MMLFREMACPVTYAAPGLRLYRDVLTTPQVEWWTWTADRLAASHTLRES